MVTRDDLIELAKIREHKEGILASMACMNRWGKTYGELVDMDANYRIASDAYVQSVKNYETALSAYTKEKTL